jgi:hypothetical protein
MVRAAVASGLGRDTGADLVLDNHKYAAIYGSTAQDHGHAVEYVYRGRNRDQMNDMADAVAAASGLTRLG